MENLNPLCHIAVKTYFCEIDAFSKRGPRGHKASCSRKRKVFNATCPKCFILNASKKVISLKFYVGMVAATSAFNF